MGLIYLVRHGENRANIERVFSHRVVDYPLTDRGLSQAARLATRFAGCPLARVYTSPLLRAQQTAAHIAQSAGVQVEEVEALREIAVGALDGRADAASWAIYEETLTRWREGDWEARFPGGESFQEAFDRLAGFVHDVSSQHAGEDVAAVGHGGLFCAVLPRLCAVPGNDEVAPLRLENAAITLLRHAGQQFTCECWGSVWHLPKRGPE
jgi:broad specificity phosphatase PhoE